MTRLTDCPMVLPDGTGVEIVREYFGQAESMYVKLDELQSFLADLCDSDTQVGTYWGMHIHDWEKQSLIEELRMYKMMYEDQDWGDDGPRW